MTGKSLRIKSTLFLVGTAVLWSTGGLFIKLIPWNPIAIASTRSAIAAVVIFAFTGKPRFDFSIHQIGGALCFACTVLCFVSATKLTTAANAILLQYTAPVYTALFSKGFLGEEPHWFDWVAVCTVVGGVALFFIGDLSAGGYLGNVIALLAGVSHAWLGLFLRKQKEKSTIETMLLGHMLAAAVGIPFLFSVTFSLSAVYPLLALGVFQIGFSSILYASALKHVKAIDAMLIVTMEPVLNPIWVYLFAGESPSGLALLGGGIVIASVTARSIGVNRLSRK